MKNTLLILGTACAVFGGVFFGAPLMADSVSSNSAPQTTDAVEAEAEETATDWRRTQLKPHQSMLAAESKLLPTGVKSILNTSGSLKHGQYLWEDEGIAEGELTIWVDLTRQLVSVFRGGHEIGTAVIVYGAEEKASPTGTFPIMRRVRDYHSRSYDAPMPYSLFITNDGVALHGSPMAPDKATHGCIGLPLEFARMLFDAASRGDVVEIVRSDIDRPKA
ncbi:L,D-transpeptidase family protein [Erythrobacter sp. W53]|uniref:L,D-transpeptidase family protein n=1 Tax=Erythrobacter sp. W53 TaxID=3425947 RepID=UPI003D76978C